MGAGTVRSLGVFAGGFGLDAAESVCDADIDALQSLVEKNLLRHTGERFWMLEMIREFAAERLNESSDSGSRRRQHADYFTELAEEAEPELVGPDAPAWTQRLRADQDNLRAALTFAREVGDGQLMLRLAGALGHYFWGREGHLREGRGWLEEALGASETPDDARALVLSGLLTVTFMQADEDSMTNYAEATIAFARGRGDNEGIQRGLTTLGSVALFQEDFDRAELLFGEVADMARGTGSELMLSGAIGYLGDTALRRGDHGRALELYLEAVAIQREMNNSFGLGVTLLNAATAALWLGQVDDASRYVREAIRLFAALPTKYGLYYAFRIAAGVAAARGRPKDAALLLGSSQAMPLESGYHNDPIEQKMADDVMRQVRAALADSTDDAIAGGRIVSLDEAVELALSLD